MKRTLTLAALAALLTLVSACAPATPAQPTPDANAIRTEAAQTVIAEFTQTAEFFSPTPLPPTETPTPEPPTATLYPTLPAGLTPVTLGTPGAAALCDNATFDPLTVDVTIPDGTAMTAGQDFVKTWKIKNTGICAWGSGYKLVFSYGVQMSGAAVPLSTLVQVGQEVEVSVNFRAPTKLGEYTSAWQMANAKGIPFGKAIYVKIIVK